MKLPTKTKNAILRRIAKGHTNKEIAEALNLKTKTVCDLRYRYKDTPIAHLVENTRKIKGPRTSEPKTPIVDDPKPKTLRDKAEKLVDSVLNFASTPDGNVNPRNIKRLPATVLTNCISMAMTTAPARRKGRKPSLATMIDDFNIEQI